MGATDKNIQTVVARLLKYREKLLQPRSQLIPYSVAQDSGVLFAARNLKKEELSTETAKTDVKYLSNISLAKSDLGGIKYKVSIAKEKADKAAAVYNDNTAAITTATDEYKQHLSHSKKLLTELRAQSKVEEKKNELSSLQAKIEKMKKEQSTIPRKIEEAECERTKYKSNLEAKEIVRTDLQKEQGELSKEFERVYSILASQKKQESDSKQSESQVQVTEVKKDPQIQLSDLEDARKKMQENRLKLSTVKNKFEEIDGNLAAQLHTMGELKKQLEELQQENNDQQVKEYKEWIGKQQSKLEELGEQKEEYSTKQKRLQQTQERLEKTVRELTPPQEKKPKKMGPGERLIQGIKNLRTPQKSTRSEVQKWESVSVTGGTAQEGTDSNKKKRPARVIDIASPSPAKLTKKDVDDAQEKSGEKEVEIREASQQIKKINQKIISSDNNIEELKKQQKDQKEAIVSSEEQIKQPNGWLKKNTIMPFPTKMRERSNPDRLDPLIARCEELLDRQKRELTVRGIVVNQAKKLMDSDHIESIEFDGAKLEETIKALKAVQDAMTQVREYRPLKGDYKKDHDSTKASLEKLEKKQLKKERTIKRNVHLLEESLRGREIQTKDLIPKENIFADTLDKFGRVLEDMVTLARKEPKLTARANEIGQDYNQCRKEYDTTLSDISKPYQLGWDTKQSYREKVVAARKKLAGQLKALIDPDKNKQLRKHPSLGSRLSQLQKRSFAVAACCTLGLALIPIGMYCLYKSGKPSKRQRKFAKVGEVAGKLEKDKVCIPNKCMRIS